MKLTNNQMTTEQKKWVGGFIIGTVFGMLVGHLLTLIWAYSVIS